MLEERQNKLFYTMGEVAEMFDVNHTLLRFWVDKFPSIKVKRNAKGNRLFTKENISDLKIVYHLVKERKMTIEGAKLAFSTEKHSAKRSAEVIEKLHNVRSILLGLKQELMESETHSAATPKREKAKQKPTQPFEQQTLF